MGTKPPPDGKEIERRATAPAEEIRIPWRVHKALRGDVTGLAWALRAEVELHWKEREWLARLLEGREKIRRRRTGKLSPTVRDFIAFGWGQFRELLVTMPERERRSQIKRWRLVTAEACGVNPRDIDEIIYPPKKKSPGKDRGNPG